MADYQTRAAALEVQVSGTEEQHLRHVGASPGVYVLAAAARNGPGVGIIHTMPDTNWFRYKAPGSSAWGAKVSLTGAGILLLEDGSDRNKWVRIKANGSHLQPGAQGRVFFDDRYNTGTAYDDVTESEATSGDVTSYNVTLKNVSTRRLRRLCVWIDAAYAAGLEISDDAATWVSPTTEATALAFADLDPAASHTLYLRRTIGAGASADPAVQRVLHIAYSGPW